jgi:hypothetical protein
MTAVPSPNWKTSTRAFFADFDVMGRRAECLWGAPRERWPIAYQSGRADLNCRPHGPELYIQGPLTVVS